MSNYKIKDRQLSEDFVLPVEKGGRVNPNLLHNWYFGNPVNRNGKTTYGHSPQYTIDRWKINPDYAYVDVNDGYITIRGNSVNGYGGIEQFYDNALLKRLIGATVTLSCYAKLYTTCILNAEEVIPTGDFDIYTTTFTLDTFSYALIKAKTPVSTDQPIADIIATKLELGDTQTLAHQNEEGNWVLNEIPDFAEQYAICCQYDKTSGEYLGLTPDAIGARPDTWMPSAYDVGAPTVEEMNEVKNSVSDGKTKVANAITAKGVTTATDATFATMANNINSITTLSSGTSDATIGAGDVLSGKIGYGKNGAKVTGTIASKAAATITPKTSNQTISAGQYLSGAQTIKGDSNLVSANIKNGVSIFGVAGSYAPAISDVLGVISSVTERSLTKGQTLSFANSPKFIVVEFRYSSNTYGVMLVSIPDLKAMVIRGELSLNKEFTVLTTGGVVQLSEGTEYVFGGNRSGSSSTFCMIRITATTIYAAKVGLFIYECA